MLQFENVCQELSLLVIKRTTLRRKLTQRFLTFKSHFRAVVSFMYSQCLPVRGNYVMANGTRHNKTYTILLRNLIVGSNGHKLLISRI